MSDRSNHHSEVTPEDKEFRSGFVSIIGAPNVGKSTLLNAFLGQKLAIVTPKPQTTRNQIRGIVTTDTHQIVFVDTPGLMEPKYRLQSEMVRTAYGALRDADIVLFIVDGVNRNVPIENQILNRLQKTQSSKKILVINKVDLVDKPTILPVFDEYSQKLDFDEMIPISAKTRDGVDLLLGQVKSLLSPGPQFFPEDQLSDLPERFFISETVREKIMLITKREVPYSTAVVVEEFEQRQKRNGEEILYIRAIVYTEKQTQKQIIIGKAGKLIKRIGELARSDIERFLDKKVFLELYVTVKSDWRRDVRKLKDIGGLFEID